MKDLLKILASAIVGAGILLVGIGTHVQTNFSGVGGPTGVTVVASSTAVTLTTASKRIMATSSKRYATEIDTLCPTGSTVFLKDSNDRPAVANTGIAVGTGTTTRTFTDSQTPLSDGSIQAITDTGTCTVLVTVYTTNP